MLDDRVFITMFSDLGYGYTSSGQSIHFACEMPYYSQNKEVKVNMIGLWKWNVFILYSFCFRFVLFFLFLFFYEIEENELISRFLEFVVFTDDLAHSTGTLCLVPQLSVFSGWVFDEV